MRRAAAGPATSASAGIASRLEALDWAGAASALGEQGWTRFAALLTADECRDLVALYDEAGRFRSKVVMERHGYGQGEYQYFARPLPELVEALRTQLYARLAPVANDWAEALRLPLRYPGAHAAFVARCRAAGQTRPTPLLLRYGPGGYNRLHQDLYGEHVFPLQVTVLLSAPEAEFTGGEFVLTEQRPRMQSRAEVVPLRQGDAVVFAVRERPARGARGTHRVQMRHGVSRLRSGRRLALGVIFHDAR